MAVAVAGWVSPDEFAMRARTALSNPAGGSRSGAMRRISSATWLSSASSRWQFTHPLRWRSRCARSGPLAAPVATSASVSLRSSHLLVGSAMTHLEDRAQSGQPCTYTRLGRAQRDALIRADLLCGQAEVDRQHDRHRLLARE